MSTRSRLLKLEAMVTPQPTYGRDTWDQDLKQCIWHIGAIAILEGISDPGADADTLYRSAIVKQITDYFVKREWGEYTRWIRDGLSVNGYREEILRMTPALRTITERLPAERRSPILLSGALTDNATHGHPWLRMWVLSAARLESRIPPDLEPNTTSILADSFATQPTRCVVCGECGLRRPVDQFRTCPHCGDTASMWENHTRDAYQRWRGTAERELTHADEQCLPLMA